MHRSWRAPAVVGICLMFSGQAHAGVYNTEEPAPWPAASFEKFKDDMDGYLSAVRPDSPRRQHYLKRVAALEAQERELGLSAGERVNLAAYYIRLGNVAATPEEGNRLYEQAVAVLEPVASDRQNPNFMALANLGMAHHMAGRLDRAAAYVEQALAAWPSGPWPGLTREQLTWYRKAEKYYLNLLKSRFEESRVPGRAPETLDPLFPRVRFVGAGGRYAAADLDPAQAAELPGDAIPIVGQLLLWMPGDSRLYWLLAELLNGQQRDVLHASDILTTLVWDRKYSFKEIQEHRQVLNAGREAARAVLQMQLTPLAWEQLSGALWPHGVGLAPGAASVAGEVGWVWHAHLVNRANRPSSQPPPDDAPLTNETGPPPAGPSSAVWMPDPKHVLVSFLAGVVITLLGTMQYRELRRRTG